VAALREKAQGDAQRAHSVSQHHRIAQQFEGQAAKLYALANDFEAGTHVDLYA
jgi:hypothetical protein